MILVTSLVGMTMGARKRAALRDSISARPDGLAKTKIPSVRRMMNGAALASLSHDKESIRTETRTRYAAARARYRIGERLRPCSGCDRCCTIIFMGWCEWCGMTHGSLRNDPLTFCDGSGVLPAKRPR